MDSLENKKLALLRIYQILYKYSDCDHPLKQEDLIRLLDNEYGIPLERKAVGRNLALLKDAGFDIEWNRGGSWLAGREFTDAELRVLIDGVLSSKYISERYSKDLINKLCNLSNKYFKSHVRHIYTVGDWDKSENQQLFYNIELIDDAIERGNQIRFDYNKYGIDKKMHKTKTHHASPYQLVLHNQRYYLIVTNDGVGWVKKALERYTLCNLYRCAFVPDNEPERKKGLKHSYEMQKYCIELLIEEITALAPDIVVFQISDMGIFTAEMRNCVNNCFDIEWEERDNYRLNIGNGKINNQKAIFINTLHGAYTT